VLEVFGDHSLSVIEIAGLLAISTILLAGYARHAATTANPLLKLGLLRIRTMRISVLGNFITRIGVGGLPFLLPLLYQISLGYTPLQSGLLIMPQSLAAMTLKLFVNSILTRFGYRHVMLANTVLIGIFIMLFATIGPGTPSWLIVIQASLFGFASSLQYTCLSTLVYADVPERDTSQAATIVSTVQQMSLSFGVATASLVAAFFIPDRYHSSPQEIMVGIHHAFILLGVFTILSTAAFYELKPTDGDSISLHREPAH
jgi:MFS family permease